MVEGGIQLYKNFTRPKHSHIALPDAPVGFKWPRKVAKSMTKTTIQSTTVSSQVAALQVPPEPFKDHPSTRGRLTGPTNKPQEKHTGELQPPIHAWTIS